MRHTGPQTAHTLYPFAHGAICHTGPSSSFFVGASRSEFLPWGEGILDAVFTHAGTGASAFVGDIGAAANFRSLEERSAFALVSCLPARHKDPFASDPRFSYHRFPIAELCAVLKRWEEFGGKGGLPPGEVHAFFAPMSVFVNEALDGCTSVLIHCIAGAHSAGTSGDVMFCEVRRGG